MDCGAYDQIALDRAPLEGSYGAHFFAQDGCNNKFDSHRERIRKPRKNKRWFIS